MYKPFLFLLPCVLLTACTQTSNDMRTSEDYPAIPVTYPETRKDGTTDDYHGTVVADDYRWLEDDNSTETKAWVQEENQVTSGYLDKIPFRKDIEDRLTELVNYPRLSSPFKVGDYYFYSRNDGLQNQAVIYYKKGMEGEEMVFIDPNALNDAGTTSINLLGADKDNRYMAYSRRDAGSDWAKIYVREIASNDQLGDELEWVKFSGAGWYGDGFFYSRYPAPAEGEVLKGNNQNHSVYFHKLGEPQSADRLVYADPGHPDYYHYGGTTEDEDYFIMYAAPGTDGFATYYLPLNGGPLPKQISPIALFPDTKNKSSVIHAEGKDFWVHTDVGAPNYRLVRIDTKNPKKANWTEIIPEATDLLQGVNTGGGYLFANYLEQATDRYYRTNYDGDDKTAIQLPGVGSAGGFGGKEEDKTLFYVYTSFIYPPTIFEYDIAANTSKPFFKPELKFNPEDYVEKQVTYQSKDGTEVTMFLVHKKDLNLDGQNPAYLYGYGGFNISLSPSFSVMRLPLLENGGVFAMTNLRGGGEYGEAWHQAGMLKNKQNVFDDFIAAGEYLIAEGYTSTEKLAIAGGSNGGLLVGAAMTQRPDLFAVAFPAVGVMDMLRYHKFTVGKGWIPEYGSSEDSSMFPVLRAYSPLHNLKPGTEYPATMITTADHDDRVVPAHSFKYAAELQAAQAGDQPVLIRIETDAGHGAGKPIPKSIEEQADMWSFFFYNTGTSVMYGVKG